MQCWVCRGGCPASLETLNLRCFQDMLEEWDGSVGWTWSSEEMKNTYNITARAV